MARRLRNRWRRTEVMFEPRLVKSEGAVSARLARAAAADAAGAAVSSAVVFERSGLRAQWSASSAVVGFERSGRLRAVVGFDGRAHAKAVARARGRGTRSFAVI